ncbi:hypothetical protein GE09DRAFT_1077198 [Coniochaeta sp. 2T2.1]|nr:hypothetical protein GE09DRAFT_1077198 [Coniochaeta sp. 2T2.1]
MVFLSQVNSPIMEAIITALCAPAKNGPRRFGKTGRHPSAMQKLHFQAKTSANFIIWPDPLEPHLFPIPSHPSPPPRIPFCKSPGFQSASPAPLYITLPPSIATTCSLPVSVSKTTSHHTKPDTYITPKSHPATMLASPVDYQLSLFQRILLIWLFITCGLVISLQAAKHHVPEGPSAKWTLTAETKPYWYTFYVLEAFLLVQITFGMTMDGIAGSLGGHEQTLLNGLWMGLLGLECLMVAGVAIRGVVRAVKPAVRVKVPAKEL